MTRIRLEQQRGTAVGLPSNHKRLTRWVGCGLVLFLIPFMMVLRNNNGGNATSSLRVMTEVNVATKSKDSFSNQVFGQKMGREPVIPEDQNMSQEAVIPKVQEMDQEPVMHKETSLWKNKNNVVHVLSTRFMQLQPDLIHLGKARIELFKTFTLRSIREQSTQEFLWIIFTDPKLDSELSNELVDLVKIHPNVLLVGRNGVYRGLRDSSSDIDPQSVFSGDIHLWKSYKEAAQNHVYVESRIDADDSMYQEFMANVQKQAAHSLLKKSKNKNQIQLLAGENEDAPPVETNEFRLFCPWHHLEWGYFNPWNKESTKGHLFGVSSPEFCITAGLTYAFQVGTDPRKVQTSHYKLDKVYPQCSHIKNTNCIDRIDAGKYKYVMLRSRTPTSAGMAGVIPTEEVVHSKHWETMQDQVWDKYIMKNFGVTPKSIWATREYLTIDMENILQDSLNGQCSRSDFTCKQASKDDLINLLNDVKKHSGSNMATRSMTKPLLSDKKISAITMIKSAATTASQASGKTSLSTKRHLSQIPSVASSSSSSSSLWKNEKKVVHVLWTRFMQLQPDLLHLGKARIELFNTFTLRSIKEQSNQDFLWLIFTDPKLNPELLHEMVDLVQDRPNIILVGMNGNFPGLRHKDPTWIDRSDTIIFSGDIQRIKDYQKAAQSHIYVESRIDADDSMFRDFMENVQQQTIQSFQHHEKRDDNDSPTTTRSAAAVAEAPDKEFRVFCPEQHLEWGYFNPWNKESTKGHLFGVTAPEFCITAGLTYAFQVGTQPLGVQVAHHKLDKTYPQCHKTAKNRNCIDRIEAGKYTYVMLRSRTPTSAGMAGVIPTAKVKSSKHWEEMQDAAWDKYILPNFGVSPTSIWTLREYLTNNMEPILLDALNGQCTRADFTCKQTSKNDLSNLLNEVKLHTTTTKGDVSTSTGRQ